MSNFGFSTFSNSISQTIQDGNPDYSPNIIKPPDRNKTHGSISKHIVIDSRDRDYLKYPTSSKYRVDIPQEFKDVTSLELTLAQIPNTYYNITELNNVFYISDSANNLSAINIPEGQYDNKTLIDTLNGKYGDLFIDFNSKLNFSRNPINLKLRIQSNRANNQDFIYNLNYVLNDSCSPCKLNSVDKTIGFFNKQFESSMTNLSYINVQPGNITNTGLFSDQDYPLYKLVADKISSGIEIDFTNIFYVNDYFILTDPISGNTYSCQIYQIKNDNTIVFEEINNENPTAISGKIFNNISILYSPNIFQVENKPYVILKIADANILNSIGASDNCYTIIPLLNLENTIINQSTIPVHSVIKYFSVPKKMLWIDVEFLNYNGTLFDFRGQENMLMFTVSMLNQPGKYNNYVDSN